MTSPSAEVGLRRGGQFMFPAKNRGGGMGLQDWWMFVVMAFVVSATSVPNMLLVMSHGASHTLLRL